MNEILNAAQTIKEEIIEIRRNLHQFPEVGSKLPKTKSFVLEKLQEFGYEAEEICESGIVATIKGAKEGKTILLRADMDALAIAEKTNLPFASQNGCMHACGHDMHAAMLLGAAKLLKNYQDEIQGTIKLVFQPNEEGFAGAKSMLQAGVLENVDTALAMHVNSGTPSNMLLYGLGNCMAGCTLFRIQVRGTGCHGAMPETGVDPLNIASHIYLSLQELIAREIGAKETAVLTIGKIVGGEAPNIIPQEVILEGSIRTTKQETEEFLYQRMENIVQATATMFRGEATLSKLASVPPLHNDPALVNEMQAYIQELEPTHAGAFFQDCGMGSEDFAVYTQEIPCAYLLLGAGSTQENEAYGKPMHNECVVFNEDVLPFGSAIYAWCALQWLKQH